MGAESIRETESITFFKDNKVATPSRVTSFSPVGGKTQPTVDKDYMADTGRGKKEAQRDPELEVYEPNSYNLS